MIDAGAGLYFAYGSNLDHDDWTAFCRRYCFDPDVLRPLQPALLVGERLVFDYRSIRRQCGALNIRPAPGRSVEGYLFAVANGGWATLDQKEGHPHRYRREVVHVCDREGRSWQAQTYRVAPDRRVGFTPPSAEYLAVCRVGRARFGLSCEMLESAATGAGC